jgi:hypothetical protein
MRERQEWVETNTSGRLPSRAFVQSRISARFLLASSFLRGWVEAERCRLQKTESGPNGQFSMVTDRTFSLLGPREREKRAIESVWSSRLVAGRRS